MNAALLIYLASVSNGIQGTFGAMAFGFGLWTFVVALMALGERESAILKYWKYSIPALFLCILLSVLTPDKQTVYMMAGAKITQDIVTSPESKELGGKILKIINQKLDEQVKK